MVWEAPSLRIRGAATTTTTPSARVKPSPSEDVRATTGQQNALPNTRRGHPAGQKPLLNHTTSLQRIDTRRTVVPRNWLHPTTSSLLSRQSFKTRVPPKLLYLSSGARTASPHSVVGGWKSYLMSSTGTSRSWSTRKESRRTTGRWKPQVSSYTLIILGRCPPSSTTCGVSLLKPPPPRLTMTKRTTTSTMVKIGTRLRI